MQDVLLSFNLILFTFPCLFFVSLFRLSFLFHHFDKFLLNKQVLFVNFGNTLLNLFIVSSQLCLNQMLKVVQFASPRVIIASPFLTISGDGWLDHVNEHIWIVLQCLARLSGLDQTSICCQDHNLVLETVCWTLVNDSVKCIAHDCDQHVKERDVRDDCRSNEKNVAE